jgi:acetyl esterase
MEPLAPGMRRTGKVLRRMPGASISRASDAEIARSSGASAPELFASILQGSKPRGLRVSTNFVTQTRQSDGVEISKYVMRTYTPAGTATGPRPIVVYFHGGGFVYGDVRGGDWLCGNVAKKLDAIVVSVGYRLAPKHPFPAGINDCYHALEWVASHATAIGGDPERIGVMGESAGGNLAAVVTLMARDQKGPAIRHQALLYPTVGAGDTQSRRDNADAFILTADDMQKFGELYAGDPNNWLVSPIKASSFEHLPPAIIIVGGHDPLHDDGVLYASALQRAGVPVVVRDYPAMPHGFMNFPRFARDARPALDAVIASQRAALA